MKIRQGFVSNSSSSSFLIYGSTIELNVNEEIVNRINEMHPEDDNLTLEEVEDMGKYEILEYLLDRDSSLEYHVPYDDEIYVGKSWDCVGDDETGRQFKERVEAEMNRVFPGYDLTFTTLSEAWRDG